MFYRLIGDNMIIKKIQVNSDKVKVYVDDSFFYISLETYLNNNLLINEEIEDEFIEILKEEDNVNSCKLSLLSILNRKKLSKKECELFLKENNLNQEKINKIISEFENNYLINDKELVEFIIDYCLFNKKGINYIKEKIRERKIILDNDLIITEYLNQDRYEKNIIYLIDKYRKLASKKSKKELNYYLRNKLTENGYNIEEFDCFILNFEVDENQIVKDEINKFFKNKKINKENIAKIVKKLLSKGFNYDIIKNAIRECEQNETY